MNIIAIAILLIAVASGLTAQSINADASKVTFDVTNMKIRTVEGSLSGMNGTLTFDQADLSICEFDVCVDATTLTTGNEKRDEHLQQPEFFDAAQHNQICFVSELVKPSNNGFAVVGQLTMKGIDKTVMIPFTFDGSTFEGNLSLSRADFGIGEGVSTFLVGDAIDIKVTCVVE